MTSFKSPATVVVTWKRGAVGVGWVPVAGTRLADNLSLAVAGVCLMLPAGRVQAQATAKVVKSDSSQIISDCNKLKALQSKIAGGEAGKLLKQALTTCEDHRQGKLTKEQWGQENK